MKPLLCLIFVLWSWVALEYSQCNPPQIPERAAVAPVQTDSTFLQITEVQIESLEKSLPRLRVEIARMKQKPRKARAYVGPELVSPY